MADEDKQALSLIGAAASGLLALVWATRSKPQSRDRSEGFQDPRPRPNWLEKVLEQHPQARAWISDRGDHLLVSDLRVQPEARGQGSGSAVMKAVLEEADRRGIPVGLTPDAERKSDQRRLERWYAGMGFHRNFGPGRNRHPEISAAWVREPRSNALMFEDAWSPSERSTADELSEAKLMPGWTRVQESGAARHYRDPEGKIHTRRQYINALKAAGHVPTARGPMGPRWEEYEGEEGYERWQQEEARRLRVHEWRDFKAEIMRHGGIAPDPDFSVHAWPRQLVRQRGMEPDLLADELGFEDSRALNEKANNLYQEFLEASNDVGGVLEPWELTYPEFLRYQVPSPIGDRSRNPGSTHQLKAEMGTLAGYKDDFMIKEFLGKGYNPAHDMSRLAGDVKAGRRLRIYRTTDAEDVIWPGAYVTVSRQYALDHGERNRGSGPAFHILEGEAYPDELVPMNPNEFFYVPRDLRAWHKGQVEKAVKDGRHVPEAVRREAGL